MPWINNGQTYISDADLANNPAYSQYRMSSPMTSSGSVGANTGGVGMSWSTVPGMQSPYPTGHSVNGYLVPGTGGGGAGTSAGSATGSASMTSTMGPAPAAPTLQNFTYSQGAQQYPWYMRGLGENMAQQAFQQQVNQGARLGASVQGVMAAQDLINRQRLGYMSSAGQQELTVQQALAEEIRRRNDEALRQYQIAMAGRGQELEYQAQMASIAARNAASGSGTLSAGGQLRAGSSGGGGTSRPQAQGTYTDIFGNVSIGSTPIKYGGSANNPYANPFAQQQTQQQPSASTQQYGPMAGGYAGGTPTFGFYGF